MDYLGIRLNANSKQVGLEWNREFTSLPTSRSNACTVPPQTTSSMKGLAGIGEISYSCKIFSARLLLKLRTGQKQATLTSCLDGWLLKSPRSQVRFSFSEGCHLTIPSQTVTHFPSLSAILSHFIRLFYLS